MCLTWSLPSAPQIVLSRLPELEPSCINMAIQLLLCLPLLWVPALASARPSIAGLDSDSWQQYIRGPKTNIVHPAGIVTNLTAGNVTDPTGFLHPHRSTILSQVQAPTPPTWPAGTVANASSYHSPNSGDGQLRTYDPQNAIDGNVTTFWNDNTLAQYPDILTIITPDPLDLKGITVLSNTDGVPIDFTVQALQNGTWSLAGTVTGNSAVQIPVPFEQEILGVTGIQITVTLDQNLASAEFTRINEVYPALVPIPPPPPTIVVDFGLNVVGFPIISFGGASNNSPGVRVAFSETLTYLTDISDFTRSDNVSFPLSWVLSWMSAYTVKGGCHHTWHRSICRPGEAIRLDRHTWLPVRRPGVC